MFPYSVYYIMSTNKFCLGCNQWRSSQLWVTGTKCPKCTERHSYLQQEKKRLQAEIKELKQEKKTIVKKKVERPYKRRTSDTVKSRLDKLYQEKEKSQCFFCGEKEMCCLDYHHVDPAQKDGTVREAFIRSLEDGIAELSKCLLVCANCHRKIHMGKLIIPEEVLKQFPSSTN